MSRLIRIGAGASAAALAIALGFAFWPQLDRSLAGGRAAVEKPVFVVPATPVKLAAAQVESAAVAPAPAEGGDAALKLAMALRANAQTTQPASTPDLGATRGLTLGSSSAPPASDAAKRLCAQGLIALAQGYIADARAYLQRAAEAGDARALLALGATYDPVTLARIGARGIKGDASRARDYYAQALAAGVTDARERMAAVASP